MPALETREVREVKVLITGYGPWRSTTINPSWLIASSLPIVLEPSLDSLAKGPCRIRLIVHPSPLKVAYDTVSTLVPQLIQEHSPDFIFHMGVAGKRDYFALETRAYREGYVIPDVDGNNGNEAGELKWAEAGVPERLDVGWDGQDVLSKWRRDLEDVGLGNGQQIPLTDENTGLVRLSTDAGRFLCEFALMTSLSYRWLEARSQDASDVAKEREGNVTFLHVPGGYGPEDIELGVKVATAAIRSLVGSWEEGYRSHL